MFYRRPSTPRPDAETAGASLPAAALTTALVTSVAIAAPSATPVKPTNDQPPTHDAGDVTQASSLPVVTAGSTTYRVQPGDTISALAYRFKVSQSVLVAANDLASPHKIRAGQTLTIPMANSGTERKKSSASSRTTTYVVKAGDSLWAIAKAHRVSYTDLRSANPGIKTSLIRPGTRLTVPARSSGSTRTPRSTGTYLVKPGDTLSHVAQAHNSTVATLRSLNPTVKNDVIVAGKTLQVPTSSSTKRRVGTTMAGRTYPPAVVAAAQRNLDALMARNVPSKARMQQIVVDTARRYGVDPALAQAVAYKESRFDMQQVSPANAVGAMQVIPSSGDWASQIVGRDLDLLDPVDNATAGILILRANLRAADNLDQAIGGYYQGLGSIRSRGMYADTRRYVASVRTLSTRFK